MRIQFNRRKYQELVYPPARWINSLEIIWTIPLLTVGILGLLDSLVIGIAITVALLPWMARWLWIGRPTCRAFLSGPMLLFVISGFLSMGVTYDPTLSWPMLLTLLGCISLFFAIVNASVGSESVAKGVIVIASMVALYFAGQYTHFHYPLETGRLAGLGRVTGGLLPNFVFVTPHPNAVAAFLEGGFLLSLVITWQYWRANSRSITIVWGTMTALIGYSLLVSGSRGSWIGLAAALGLWGLLLVSNRTLRLTVIGIGGVVTLVGIYILFCRFSVVQQLPGLASTLQTFHSRFVLYRNSFYLLEDYFITGIGLGDVFALVYSRYQLLIPVPFLTYAHNMFLSIGLSLGVLGLMAFSWLLLSFYRFVVQSERAGMSPQLSPLFRGSWLGVSVIFVHGLFDSAQFASSAWTMPMLFALLGLSVKIGNPALLAVSEERASGRSLRGKSRWVRLIPVGFVILLAAAGIIFRDSLLSVWYTNIGAVYQTRADLAPDIDAFDRQTARLQAADNFERALEWNPDNPAANRRSGLLALEHGDFYAAIRSLERAHQSELQDQATLKALGLAYLWAGRLDSAEVLLRQLDPPGNLPNQLAGWRWWWRTRERADLSAYADEMLKRLYPAR